MTATRTKKILLLIEPAPYVFDFLAAIGIDHRTDVAAFFVSRGATQSWTLPAPTPAACGFLPSGRLAAWRYLWRTLSDPSVCLLHTAGWSGSAILCAWCIAWWREIPIYVESDTALHLPRPVMSRVVRRVLYPWFFRLPFRFLPAGRRQMLYLKRFGVTADRIRIHQMSIDVGRVSRSVEQIRVERPRPIASPVSRFLFVGRLESCKGLPLLVSAFRACLARHGQLQLRIVGDGVMGPELKHASADLPSLIYDGRLEGDDLMAAYAAADVFILPSLVEAWGLVVNEAMAARLPVIATTQVGCVDDLVRDGENGFVVPAGDSDALRDAMLRLVEDAELSRRMGDASRRRIAEWTMEDQARIIQHAWTEAC